MRDAELREIDFTSLGPEILTKLGEDFVRALSVPNPMLRWLGEEKDCADRISEVVLRARASPTGLSSRDAIVLAGTFHEAVSLGFTGCPDWCPLFRLYAHALLRGSRIFPNMELYDEPLDYEPLGFVDIWKGKYHGDQICIKAIRAWRTTAALEEMKRIHCHEVEGYKHLSHPNLLPLIEVSETLFPLCIMSPWMPDGNIVQYTQKNQSANRLMLLAEVCGGLSYLHGHSMITTCWSGDPKMRWEVPAVSKLLLTSSLQGAQDGNSEQGDSDTKDFSHASTSLFQFLRDPEPEIESLVNEMDKRLEDHALSDRERLKLFNKFCKTCNRHRVLPKSMRIPDCSEGSVEVASGGYVNVSRGTYEGRQVAIKIVRVYTTSNLDVILSKFCREGVAWKHLRHPKILPLIGVTVSNRRFAMVSTWMENGNINEFAGKDRHVNRVDLLVDVANGLKGANILINEDRRACIADFGLTTITGIVTHATAGTSQASLISNDTLMSFTAGGTYRWMSPELLDPERFGMPESEDNRPTKQSDCYALGMVVYEVICGHHPYVEFESNVLVINAITEGDRPKKPKEAVRLGFSNELWRTIELCWLEDRNARPDIEDIISCLSDATALWHMRGITYDAGAE